MFVICNLLTFAVLGHSQTSTYFTEVADSIGVDHYNKHNNFNGGGCAFFDSDGDGDDDIYLVSGSDRDQLLINTDGQFEEAGFLSGLGLTDNYYTTGVVTGDLNNDGLEDIFVTTHGSGEILSKNILFMNKGNNEYQDTWLQLDSIEKSAGAVLIDFDNDGLLDIYVLNYVDEAGFIRDTANVVIGYDHLCYSNTLYHNLGNMQFNDVTDLNLNTDTEQGCSLAAMATDFDRDRDIDLLVCNDFGADVVANRLLTNTNGAFLSQTQDYGFDDGIYSMGMAGADLDHDLDMDYYVTNFGANLFIENRSDTLYSSIDSIASSANNSENPGELSISWGAVFTDYNNDGNEDLYIANGYVPAPPFLPSSFQDKDRFYESVGGFEYLEPQSSLTGLENINSGRGVAVSDYDNDGDQDLLVNVMRVPINGEMKSHFYQNQLNESTSDSTHWIQVKLEGLVANKSACGANVELYHSEDQVLKEVTCGNSHGSSSSKTLHFGVGASKVIDSLRIFWPNSEQTIDTYTDLAVDSLYLMQEDTSYLVLDEETEIDTVQIVNDGGFSELVGPKKYIGIVLYRSVDDQAKSENTKLNLYPNPVSSESIINVECNKPLIALSINSLTGQLVKTYGALIDRIQDGDNDYYQAKLDVSEINSGVYFLSVTTPEGEQLRKVIIY